MKPTPSCEEVFEALNAALDGEAPLLHRTVVDAHLEDCALCRARRARLGSVAAAMRTGAPRAELAPAALRARVESLTRRGDPARRLRLAAVVVVSAAAGAVLTLALTRSGGDDVAGVVTSGVALVGSDQAPEARPAGSPVRVGERVHTKSRAALELGRGVQVALWPGAALADLEPQSFTVERAAVQTTTGVTAEDVRIRVAGGSFVVSGGARVAIEPTAGVRGAVAGPGSPTPAAGDVAVETWAGAVLVQSAGGVQRVPAGEGVLISAGRMPRAFGLARAAAATGAPLPAGALEPMRVLFALGAGTDAANAEPADAGAAIPDAGKLDARPMAALDAGDRAPDAEPPALAEATTGGGGQAGQSEETGETGIVRPAAVAVSRAGTLTGLVRIKGQAQGRDVEHESDPCATGPAQGRVAGAVVRLSPTPATAAVPRLVLRPCGWSSVGAAAVTGVGLDVENATDTAVTILGMDQPARIEPGHSERLVGSFASVRTLAVLERPAWTAKVLVGPELGVAVTDGRGRFEFAGLPEGAYTVSARNGIAGDSSAAVQVGSEAGYADLEIDDITVVNRNTCRIAVGDSVIARACREGGRRRARFVMTSMVRAVRSEHVRLDCDGCHTNEADYSLSENAVQDFKALAALYARLRRR